MTKLQKKVATAIATGALLFNTALPAFADETLEISGNGADTYNKAEVDVNQNRTVVQSNEANISNNVTATADTGDNDANRNTGGGVSVTTGDAKTTVDILNQANANSAKISGDGEGGSLSARILGNGADSYNKIELDYNKSVVVDQSNSARVENDVYAKADTGDNDANRNTGGTVSIDTGDAETKVGVDNMINFNWAD